MPVGIQATVQSVGDQAQAIQRLGGQNAAVGTQAGNVGTQASSVGTQTQGLGLDGLFGDDMFVGRSVGTQGPTGTQASPIGAQASPVGTQASPVGKQSE